MKSKKYIILFVFLFIIILITGWCVIKYLNNKKELSIEEYIPEEEIAEEQTRSTIVTVYFPNKETGKLIPEAKIVDVKEIVNNPYEKILNTLIQGPISDQLVNIFPENTKILNTNKENDIITINLSSDFLNFKEEKNASKENLIKSIVNSLTELTEVNKVKILIEGQENDQFNSSYERFAK